MNTDKKPYVFDKRTHKAVVAAEVVLGPRAVRRIINSLLNESNAASLGADENLLDAIAKIFSFIDLEKQVVIKTDAGVVEGLTIETVPKEVSIDDDFQGYTLIDLKTAITEAMRGDITGFVLEMIQLKWQRELTMDDAISITFHLNKLIQLLT